MIEMPKEKLTVADLVEAQRDTADQLRLLNEKLQKIEHLTHCLATTDERSYSPQGWEICVFIFLLMGVFISLANPKLALGFIGFELAILSLVAIRMMRKTPALTRWKQIEDEEMEANLTREANAKEWDRWFGKKRNKPLTPPAA